VPHTEENVLGFYKDGGEWVPYWADNVPVHVKKHFDKMLAAAFLYVASTMKKI
jgi:hypothetical protein